jgi:hypothetical protein
MPSELKVDFSGDNFTVISGTSLNIEALLNIEAFTCVGLMHSRLNIEALGHFLRGMYVLHGFVSEFYVT